MGARTHRISVLRMLHQPRHPTSQRRARVLGNDIFERFPEINGPLLGWSFLCEVVAVLDHLVPVVAVEIVYGSACRGVCQASMRWAEGRSLPEPMMRTFWLRNGRRAAPILI